MLTQTINHLCSGQTVMQIQHLYQMTIRHQLYCYPNSIALLMEQLQFQTCCLKNMKLLSAHWYHLQNPVTLWHQMAQPSQREAKANMRDTMWWMGAMQSCYTSIFCADRPNRPTETVKVRWICLSPSFSSLIPNLFHCFHTASVVSWELGMRLLSRAFLYTAYV